MDKKLYAIVRGDNREDVTKLLTIFFAESDERSKINIENEEVKIELVFNERPSTSVIEAMGECGIITLNYPLEDACVEEQSDATAENMNNSQTTEKHETEDETSKTNNSGNETSKEEYPGLDDTIKDIIRTSKTCYEVGERISDYFKFGTTQKNLLIDVLNASFKGPEISKKNVIEYMNKYNIKFEYYNYSYLGGKIKKATGCTTMEFVRSVVLYSRDMYYCYGVGINNLDLYFAREKREKTDSIEENSKEAETVSEKKVAESESEEDAKESEGEKSDSAEENSEEPKAEEKAEELEPNETAVSEESSEETEKIDSLEKLLNSIDPNLSVEEKVKYTFSKLKELVNPEFIPELGFELLPENEYLEITAILENENCVFDDLSSKIRMEVSYLVNGFQKQCNVPSIRVDDFIIKLKEKL